MPTYEYRCLDCKHEFEQFQSMKDDPLKICPECNGSIKRLIGRGAGIIFKGSGFYETDYKKKAAPAKESNSESSSSSSSNSSTKSESKPEASKAAS